MGINYVWSTRCFLKIKYCCGEYRRDINSLEKAYGKKLNPFQASRKNSED
jgi:hypothetical protein